MDIFACAIRSHVLKNYMTNLLCFILLFLEEHSFSCSILQQWVSKTRHFKR